MSYRPQNDRCYHCNEAFTEQGDWSIKIGGIERQMCCAGCLTVAQMLVDNQLADYYQFRTNAANKPESIIPEALQELESQQQSELIVPTIVTQDEKCHIDLAIEGMTCAACAWVIEKKLQRLNGVLSVKVNAVTRRAAIEWQENQLEVSQVVNEIHALGFKAYPYRETLKRDRFQVENRQWLLRIGVASLCTMQVMMISVGLYLGYGEDLNLEHQSFMRWVSALLALPVLLFAARPFLDGAWNSIRHGQLNIDVPVSLAISLAYCASIYTTLVGHEDVYFDSVCMFTLFLLVGRYLEHRSRFKMVMAGQHFQHWLPQQVQKYDSDERLHKVSLQSLIAGDHINVSEGEVIPVDGHLVYGVASIDQAFLTGEFAAAHKGKGDPLLAGSVNMETPIRVKVEKVGQETQWANLLRLQQQAEQQKPKSIGLLNSVARWFVLGVLLITISVAVYWWQVAPENVLPIVLSVLIISCPCALSLAAPTAITCATKRLGDLRVLVIDSDWIETLTKVKHIVFDKTGTLTEGKLSIKQRQTFAGYSESKVAAIVANLEQGGHHPIAVALSQLSDEKLIVNQRTWVTGGGCYGDVEGQVYYLGSWPWLKGECSLVEEREHYSGVYLVVNKTVIAHFEFDDSRRAGIEELIRELNRLEYRTHILSGDSAVTVAALAQQLGVSQSASEMTPQQKLDYITQLQQSSARVLMVGDGLNDAAVLAQADVSLAMGGGVTHAKESAGAILSSNQVADLTSIVSVAKLCKRIIKQNIIWAISYNLIAIPFAAVGWIPPWLAAIGMTLSSTFVLLNALRILNFENKGANQIDSQHLTKIHWMNT